WRYPGQAVPKFIPVPGVTADSVSGRAHGNKEQEKVNRVMTYLVFVGFWIAVTLVMGVVLSH
ncbi:hypothetical protein AFK69_18915, partial [Xenorhabdus sp. GDc328]|uniref:hypothetical protein n=1 Tax=Xenorhabdus sp. GDc328 TaxID=742178 RepID=UPI0006C6AF2D